MGAPLRPTALFCPFRVSPAAALPLARHSPIPLWPAPPQWDLLCGCCAITIHSLHFASMVASVPARQLAPLLAQGLLAALTLAGFMCR